MTDLNKEREAFEAWFTTTDVYKRISHQIQMCGSGRHQDIFTVFQRDDWREENYVQVSVMASWLAWQEKAKAQAVPEGYKLVPVELSENIAERLAFERVPKPRPENDPVWVEIAERAYKSNLLAKKWELVREYKILTEASGSGANQ
ncbi:hypothetical protein OHV40_17595 [Acinetobacter baumannii]|nr:hypothetical protein [Acinetobacter baumannii]